MAVIDFKREKAKRDKNADVDYREKIRAHRLSVFFRSLIIAAVVILVIVLLNLTWQDKLFTEISVLNSSPVSVVTGSNVRNLGGSLLIYSKDGVSCVDEKGKAVWNRSYEMQAPIVAISQNTVAIGDYNGRNIYVANKDNLLGTIRTNLPIRSISVSDNGEVAAVLDDSDVVRIYVYDGNKDTETPIVMAKATMNKSGYPVKIALSPNGKLMMVSYFYVDSGSMKSSIAFYNFGEVGSNETDNYVSGYDYADSVVPYVSFLDNDSAFGISDDRIIFFDGGEKPVNQATSLLNEEVMGVYSDSRYVGLVFRDQSGEAIYRLDIYNDSGTLVNSLFFDLDYTDIVFSKDQVVIYSDTECLVRNVKGQERFAGLFPSAVKALLPTSQPYRYVLVTGESIDLTELK
ncbi:MAG: DUF5711 family protein [Lachnospiraceae bacterium]|nr:DUF5711 family protein [Lachnospiraceae bacterium]